VARAKAIRPFVGGTLAVAGTAVMAPSRPMARSPIALAAAVRWRPRRIDPSLIEPVLASYELGHRRRAAFGPSSD
jgi:hypothetical protein